MRNRIIMALLAVLVSLPAVAQPPMKEVVYKASEEDFINPERGFMSQLSHPREPIDAKVLAGLRAKKEAIIWRMFQVRDWRDRPFTEEYLASVRRFRCHPGGRHESHAALVVLQPHRR